MHLTAPQLCANLWALICDRVLVSRILSTSHPLVLALNCGEIICNFLCVFLFEPVFSG